MVPLWTVPLGALVGALSALLWAVVPAGSWSFPIRVVFYVTTAVTAAAVIALAAWVVLVWPSLSTIRDRIRRERRPPRPPKYRPAPW